MLRNGTGKVDDGGNAEHGDQQRCDDGEGDDEFIGKLAAGKFVEIFAGGDGEADGGRQAGEDDGDGEAVCADAAEEAAGHADEQRGTVDVCRESASRACAAVGEAAVNETEQHGAVTPQRILMESCSSRLL